MANYLDPSTEAKLTRVAEQELIQKQVSPDSLHTLAHRHSYLYHMSPRAARQVRMYLGRRDAARSAGAIRQTWAKTALP